MKLLLPGTFLTILALSSSVDAATLQSWRFDLNQNQLEFTTDGAVQPQAQLLFNPTRLVIDLPGTRFQQKQLTKPVGGAIRSIQVRQSNQSMTRIIIELATGYTLNPNQVKFEGQSANRWRVQLPKIEVEQNNTSSSRNIYNVVTNDSKPNSPPPRVAQTTTGITQIEDFKVTGDGVFIRTSGGGKTQIRSSRSSERLTSGKLRTHQNIDISGASLSPNLTQLEATINRFGLSRLTFSQKQDTKPTVRISLEVDSEAADWRITPGGTNALVLLPQRLPDKTGSSVSQNQVNNNFPAPTTSQTSPFPGIPNSASSSDTLATIQSVDLNGDGSQLMIRGDRQLSASTNWDRASGMFQITVNNARLAPRVNGPLMDANSPILRVRLQEQQQSRSVVILVQPAAGVQIGQLNQITGQFLALELRRNRTITGGLPPLPNSRPLPGSSEPIINNPNPNPNPNFPPVPNGRLTVIIDPGHGGKDPGAVGIGGSKEKDVILPIGIRVAQILQQNGIQALMTRNSDYFVSLQGRVDMASQANANVFVSIHANSAGSSRPDVNGLETYYYDSGLALAQTVHSTILQSLNVRDRGVRKARFFVLRKSSMPSILVEVGYMTGQQDIAKLRSTEYQNQMADAIARGIILYLRQR
ncbi:N-acetylmuramoyl-L-alanine amidase [Calothrix sp. PCC 6303]|uniref:N-acetylmuramoyl-L-alanine amidase n=1 Tax=Calothrix sp. PCC 6303 TaxID=1170562 RepID=UPI0002A038A8|nr:N-acetylmuramoyl-L-alanine amidase [Calothrix sp. PCC 6303]AFZ03689.1 N-acetylmuramoyl-L-alanine amidase [Calothrix sp. PCC 6303]